MTRITRRELLCSALLASGGVLLAACQPPKVPEAPAKTAPAEQPAVAPLREANLIYYIGFGAGGAPAQVEAVKKMFARFSEAQPQVKVEPLVVAWAEAPRKFQAMVAAGTPPDVITMGMSQWDFAAKGAFSDIRPFLEADKVDMDDWEPAAVEAYTVKPRNNLLYGLPFALNAAFAGYNKTMWDKAGLKAPTDWEDPGWTWDALLDAAQTLTKRSGDNIEEFGMLSLGNWDIPWMFGGNWVSDDGTRITLDSPQSIKGFTYVQDLIFKHRVAPTAAESAALVEGFLSGRVGYFHQGTWGIGTLLEIEEFEWDFAPVAYAPELGVDHERATPYYPDSLVISSKKHVPESWALVRYLLLDDTNYKEFLQIMSMVPARKRFRSWFYDEFWKGSAPDKNWSVIEDVWPYAQVQRLFLNINWSEANNTQAAELGAVWTNESTPDKVIPELAKKLDEIWQRGLVYG
jgi:multiple sugar transport system substrate-binding protein